MISFGSFLTFWFKIFSASFSSCWISSWSFFEDVGGWLEDLLSWSDIARLSCVVAFNRSGLNFGAGTFWNAARSFSVLKDILWYFSSKKIQNRVVNHPNHPLRWGSFVTTSFFKGWAELFWKPPHFLKGGLGWLGNQLVSNHPNFFGVGLGGSETTPNSLGWGGVVWKPPQIFLGWSGFKNTMNF